MRIGSFCQKIINRTTCRSATGCSTLLACVIAALFLLIGGVEMNPGPTMAELAKRLEEFFSSYNATRDEILLSVSALSSRLDEFVKDMSSLVNNMNELMKKQKIRLCALEQSLLSNPQTTYKGNSTKPTHYHSNSSQNNSSNANVQASLSIE